MAKTTKSFPPMNRKDALSAELRKAFKAVPETNKESQRVVEQVHTARKALQAFLTEHVPTATVQLKPEVSWVGNGGAVFYTLSVEEKHLSLPIEVFHISLSPEGDVMNLHKGERVSSEGLDIFLQKRLTDPCFISQVKSLRILNQLDKS